MASKYTSRIIIDVKNGDAFDNNRLPNTKGEKTKSNTGTYFLCSSKDFSQYNLLFENCIAYYIDIQKVFEYKILFKENHMRNSHKYSDNMINFSKYCDEIINSNYNKISNISLRKNGERYFLRFADNQEFLVYNLRHVLYGEISSLVLEFVNDKCYVYPELKYQSKIFFD